MVIMEHPKRSWIPNAPSSWLLPELTWVRDLPNALSIDIDQCMFEAPSQKPTTLLCLNCLHIRQAIRAAPNGAKCNHSSHASVLIGRKSDGPFATAPSKQYPGPMDSMLARVTYSHIRTQMVNLENGHSPCDLHNFVLFPLGAFYVPLDPYNPDQVLGQFGSDFANSSSVSESTSLPCVPALQPTQCVLPDIRNEIRRAFTRLCDGCPEFTTSPSALSTPYVASSLFTSIPAPSYTTCSSNSCIQSGAEKVPGGDMKVQIAHQGTAVQYFRRSADPSG